MLVREIMRIKGSVLYTAKPGDSLMLAVETMAELDAGSLVVMDQGKMAGMLTFREILRAMRDHAGNVTELKVADVMVKDPVTADVAMEANELRRLMIEKHMRYLPVMEGSDLQGVISFLDIAKAVLEEQSFENQMLKNYIKNWPAEEEKA